MQAKVGYCMHNAPGLSKTPYRLFSSAHKWYRSAASCRARELQVLPWCWATPPAEVAAGLQYGSLYCCGAAQRIVCV
jgi:hypothetical protein